MESNLFEAAQTVQLTSSVIKTANFMPMVGMLLLTFQGTGKVYAYFGVPGNTFLDLTIAPSAGKFYNSDIKGRFESREITSV